MHTGTVTVGNVGGSTLVDDRALGDPVITAARVGDIAAVKRNDMDVQMENSLSGRLTDIHADVVSVRCVLLFDRVPSDRDRPCDCSVLVRRGVKP